MAQLNFKSLPPTQMGTLDDQRVSCGVGEDFSTTGSSLIEMEGVTRDADLFEEPIEAN